MLQIVVSKKIWKYVKEDCVTIGLRFFKCDISTLFFSDDFCLVIGHQVVSNVFK